MDHLDRLISVIVYADIVGYSSLMEKDEQLALSKLVQFEKAIKLHSKVYAGEVVKWSGDGCLILFSSAVKAVECSIRIQKNLRENPQVPLRVGIHIGEIVRKDRDVFGDAVNIAARVESMGIPNSILISSDVFVQIKNHADFTLTKIGDFNLKNISRAITLYAVSDNGLSVPNKNQMLGKGKFKKPRDFFPSGSRFLSLLASLLILSFLGYVLFQKSSDFFSEDNFMQMLSGQKNDTITFIGVLPFSNSKPDPETDYFGFAIADQIIGDLTYLKNLSVRPSSSIRQYENKVFDPISVGRQLQVNYLLTGNYLREENIIRLNFELIDVEKNEVRWREGVEVNYQNAFALQDKVAEYVLKGMDAQFSQAEAIRIHKDIPNDPLAYEYYLRSISYPFSNEGDRLAIEMLTKSIELDSTYAPAYNQLAERNSRLAQYGMLDPEETDRSEHYHLKALSLNKDLLGALGSLSLLYTETGRIEEAVKLTKRMLEINPNHAEAHFSLGYSYRYAGMNQEAIQEMEKAVQLDRNNEQFRSLGLTYVWAGEYDNAIEAFQKYRESAFILSHLGFISFRQGRYEQALDYFDQTIEMEPEGLMALTATGVKMALLKETDQGLVAAKKFEDRNLKDAESWYFNAGIYGLLGDQEGCLRCLRRAVDGGFFNYPLISSDFYFDSVREDPVYLSILSLAMEKHLAFKQMFFHL